MSTKPNEAQLSLHHHFYTILVELCLKLTILINLNYDLSIFTSARKVGYLGNHQSSEEVPQWRHRDERGCPWDAVGMLLGSMGTWGWVDMSVNEQISWDFMRDFEGISWGFHPWDLVSGFSDGFSDGF